MPYGDVSELPANVKKLPAKRARQWMHVWNSSYQACMADEFAGSKKCEAEAFKRANGVAMSELEYGILPTYHTFIEAAEVFSGADYTKPQWIPFLPKPGKYAHPRYGEVEITPERNQQMIDSFKKRVYQQHIPLDAEHHTKLSGAVAWMNDMRLNDDGGADALVEWTGRGQSLMTGGQFRYISPEWFDEWTDPATNEVHKNVVAGGAITTRPFFKDGVLRALVMSESGGAVIGDEPYWFRDFSPEKREELSNSGAAMSDGSYPIVTEQNLRTAIHEVGRAKDPSQAKEHIKKRAEALGKTDLVPKDWSEEYVDMVKCPNCGKMVKEGATCPECGKKMTEQTITLTEQQLDERIEKAIKAANETQAATYDEKITELTGKVTASETAATAEKEAREAAEKRVGELEKTNRHQRFVDVVMGRGENDGAKPWLGEPDKNVAFLEQLAEKFGEDNEVVTQYVEQQNAIAAQAKEAGLFSQSGSAASGSRGGDDADSKIDQMVKKVREANPKLTEAQAYTEVMETPEAKALYDSSHSTGRKA